MKRTAPAGLSLVFLLISVVQLSAADWEQIVSNDSTLWYDVDSVEWGDENDDYVYFYVFHGAKSSDDWMTQASLRIAVDCADGDIFVWDTGSSDWKASATYDKDGPIGALGFDECWMGFF
jgi:hypothetical protein